MVIAVLVCINASDKTACNCRVAGGVILAELEVSVSAERQNCTEYTKIWQQDWENPRVYGRVKSSYEKQKIIFNTVFLLLGLSWQSMAFFMGSESRRCYRGYWECGQTLGFCRESHWCSLFYLGESAIIWYMMRSYGEAHLKKTFCFLFIGGLFFWSCITPSASGGQPMQIYYMKKEKASFRWQRSYWWSLRSHISLYWWWSSRHCSFWKRLPSSVSGGDPSGLLSGTGTEYLLCYFYDRACVSSGSCQKFFW